MKNKIFFTIFMIVWILLILLNFIVPNKEFSEQENRYLAKVPSFSFEDLVNGEYAESLDTYINDHFIFRNFWLKLNSTVQLSSGKTENNGVYIGKDGYLFEKFEYTKNEEKNLQKAVQAINDFANKTNTPTYFLLAPNSIYINRDKLPNNVEVANQEEIIKQVYSNCNENVKTINIINTLEANKNLQLYYFN